MREMQLLQQIFSRNHTLSREVTIPPGDDMAAVRFGDQDVLIAVDQLADGVHFDLATTPVGKIARKLITRNLSDVAAMAAIPRGVLVAASLPRNFPDTAASELIEVVAAVAQSYQCPLIGGDLSVWDQRLLLSATVLASDAGIGPVTRHGARIGDAVCVTGRLGGSLLTVRGYTHHLDFEPRLQVARTLANDPRLGLHCMIDLSDGLAKDLTHLCRSAGVGADLWADQLPISEAATIASKRDHLPAWQHALADGEDYELCFTLPEPATRTALPDLIDRVPVTQVGVIRPRDDDPIIKLYQPDGTWQPVDDLGWEHCG